MFRVWRKGSLFHPSKLKTHTVNYNGVVYKNKSLPAICRFLSLESKEKRDQKEQKGDFGSIKKMVELLKEEKKMLSLGIGVLGISTAITLSIPAGMGHVIDLVTSPDAQEKLPIFASGLAGLMCIGALANSLRVALMIIVSQRVVKGLRQKAFSSLMRQEIAFFDSNRTGELVTRLSSDTQVVGQALTENLGTGLRSIAQAIGGISLMFYISPKLCGIMMSIVPPVAFSAILYGRYVKKISKNAQAELAKSTEIAEERLSNIRTVRWFAQEKKEICKYLDQIQKLYELEKKEGIATGVFFGGADFGVKISILGVLFFGGQLVLENHLSLGDLTSFLMYTIYVGGSAAGLSSFYSDLMKGLGASSRLFELIERQPKSIQHIGSHTLPFVSGKLEFKDIDFCYPTRPNQPVLKGFNLTISPGETVALVGTSGSGKSTVAALLAKFYEPNRGTILLDDHDIMDLDSTWLHHHMVAVSQEPVLFAGTIFDNISYGREGASEAEVFEAAKLANAHNFIRRFTDGYQTYVGERGLSISGGQKQRIAIARALLTDPRLLILDEATSALDAESEDLVQEAIERLLQGRTVLVIAHRMSTIRRAKRVVVLQDGTIVEQGNPEALLANESSVFYQFMQSQVKELQGRNVLRKLNANNSDSGEPIDYPVRRE